MMPYNNMPQNNNEDYYKNKFMEHAALSEHYARQKMANAANEQLYYQFAELEYYHKSRAIHYKAYFMANTSLDTMQ